MKRLILFMIVFLSVKFISAKAEKQPPTAKDVGFEYSINLDTQNYEFSTITFTDVYVYSCDNSTFQFITLYRKTDVKSEMQSEGLQNLKYPSINSQFIYNYFLSTSKIATPQSNKTNMFLYKYPLLC